MGDVKRHRWYHEVKHVSCEAVDNTQNTPPPSIWTCGRASRAEERERERERERDLDEERVRELEERVLDFEEPSSFGIGSEVSPTS